VVVLEGRKVGVRVLGSWGVRGAWGRGGACSWGNFRGRLADRSWARVRPFGRTWGIHGLRLASGIRGLRLVPGNPWPVAASGDSTACGGSEGFHGVRHVVGIPLPTACLWNSRSASGSWGWARLRGGGWGGAVFPATVSPAHLSGPPFAVRLPRCSFWGIGRGQNKGFLLGFCGMERGVAAGVEVP